MGRTRLPTRRKQRLNQRAARQRMIKPLLSVQLTLFDVPAPVKRTHTWMWRPGPSECARCELLWFPGASRAEVVAFLTEPCPCAPEGART
jgi:hypothetical protein